MQKKCIKKKAAGQKECISKNKNAKGSQKKCQKKKAEQQFKKKAKNAKKNAHTTKFHTPPFLCDFWWHFWHFLRFLGMRLHFLCFFVRVFLRFFAFSQGNAQKMKKNAKKTQIQSKKCKGKDPNVFYRIRFAFWLHFLHFLCIVFAFCVPFLCIFAFLCGFLHWFSGQMRFFRIFYVFFAFQGILW